jgi:WD40 repeat protein
MHIYHSALLWTPTPSPIRKLYQRQMATEVKLVNAIDAHWNALIRKIPIHRSLTAIIFSLNGSALAVVTGEYVQTFETATGVATLEVDQSATSIAFSRDNAMLVCGFIDGTIRVWDGQTSNLVQSFVGHGGRIFSVVFSPRQHGCIC